MADEVVLSSEEDPNEELDLGHMVAIWHVEEMPGGGKLFDLLECEDVARAHINPQAPMKRTMTFDADQLPAGAALVMTYPKEVTHVASAPGDPEGDVPAGDGDTG